MFKNILLIIVSICTMISYLPQIKKIIISKSSEDLSIKSWVLWVVSTSCYAMYAWFYVKDYMLMFSSTLEFLFCLIILILTIRYSNN